MLRRLLIPMVVAALVGAVATPAYAACRGPGLGQVRHVTARYHNVAVAEYCIVRCRSR